MSHLVLELRPGEMMVVNGATIRFRTRCRIELVSQARFLFGKQIMAAHEAATSIRQLYYRLQTAYVGPVEDRVEASRDACAMFTQLRTGSSPEAVEALGRAEKAFAGEDFYQALKIVRSLIQDEGADHSAP